MNFEGLYDYLAAQAAEAQEQANQLAQSSSITVTGTAQGQIAIWSGTAFVAAGLSGDSNGVSVAVVTSPAFGLRVALSQNLTTAGSPTFAGLTLTAPLSVANGGTGAANAASARSNLGTGGIGSAVANLGTVASAGYVQAELQATIDKLNALLNSLRTAGVIAT